MIDLPLTSALMYDGCREVAERSMSPELFLYAHYDF